MGSMAVNFVGGIPFRLLYDGVKLLLGSTRIFRTQLINLEFTLDSLQPRILQEIGDNSVQVNLPSNIIQELQTKISDGTELVKKLSRLSIWNIRIWGNCWNFIKPNYAEQLDQLDRWLRALIEQLDMEQRRNVTLLLCSVRNLQDKNDEWEDKFSKFLRGQEELKVLLLGNSDAIGRIEANSVQQVASSSREEAVPSPAKNLGLVFTILFNVVARVQVKNKMIKRVLEELKSTLNCLQPLIEEMAEYDKILQLPKQEVEDLRKLISNCVEYAKNCSKVGEHANYKKYICTNKILNSNQSLQRLYINLKGQVDMKVKEAMDSASKIEVMIKKIEGDSVVPNDELRSERQSRVPQPGLNLLTMEGPLDVIKETSEISESITEEPSHMVETSVNLERFREEGVEPIERSGDAEQQKTEIKSSCQEILELPPPASGLDVMNLRGLVEVKTSPTLYLDAVDVHGTRDAEKTSKMLSKITNTLKRKRIGLTGNCYGSSSAAHPNPYTKTASTSATSETQSRNRASQTSSSSTGRSQFSQISEATTSTLSPKFDDYGDSLKSTDGQILEESSLKVFTFADMKSATKNFKSDLILGEGGFGRVFKGWVDEKTLQPCKAGTGMMVAVKQLNPESMQGYQEWQSEVNFLGRLSHPNLVKLLGYCLEDTELLLVYEYMQKGSLKNHLFRRNPNIEPLSWDNRIKIAIGAARGLAFLHSLEKQIIYRDFKASNILLDGSYNAKISDFGLAKLGPTGGDSHVSTRVMGTYGYAAPEYIATGHLYVKSDVYGFGVVLLEILTGLRALDTKRPKKQLNLIEWAKPLLPHKRKLKNILDARIEGQYNLKAAIQTANVTLKCLAPDPKSRPSMKEVLEELEQVQAIRLNTKNLDLHLGSLY